MSEAPAIRCLIADDEPLARSRLENLLIEDSRFEIAGIADSGSAALAFIEQHAPQLVFLDIQMPGLSGFEVLDRLDAKRLPHVVFVTAYDEYAVRAFEVHALDYLLKPFARARFRAALDRAAERVGTSVASDTQSDEIVSLLRELRGPREHLRRLAVADGDRMVLVAVEDVEWIEANGKTVRVHSGGRSFFLQDSMKALERKLDPHVFLRVHRSAIVNLEHISEIHPWFKGTLRLVLSSGEHITTGRKYGSRVQDLYRNRPT